MRYFHLTSNSTSARFFTVLALLFMLGSQVLESSHNHVGGESAASCILSHSGAGAALLASVPGIPAFIAAGMLVASLPTKAKLAAVAAAHLPRGPPRNA